MRKRNNKPKFKVNGIVRISKFKRHFEKGHAERWSNEFFIIYKDNRIIPYTYKIKTIENKMVVMST